MSRKGPKPVTRTLVYFSGEDMEKKDVAVHMQLLYAPIWHSLPTYRLQAVSECDDVARLIGSLRQYCNESNPYAHDVEGALR